MNEKVLKTLEYTKITEMLAGKAGSAPGKKLCRELVPSTDLDEIRRNQRQTADEQQEHAGQQSLHGTSRAPEFTPDEDAPYRGDHWSALPQRIRDRGAGFTGGNVAESRT